jgi:hypothetical protein
VDEGTSEITKEYLLRFALLFTCLLVYSFTVYCLNQDLQDWLRLSPSCSAEANKFASALASCVDLRISRITVETLPATSLQKDNHKVSFLRNAGCWGGTLFLPSDAFLRNAPYNFHLNNHVHQLIDARSESRGKLVCFCRARRRKAKPIT